MMTARSIPAAAAPDISREVAGLEQALTTWDMESADAFTRRLSERHPTSFSCSDAEWERILAECRDERVRRLIARHFWSPVEAREVAGQVPEGESFARWLAGATGSWILLLPEAEGA